MIIANRRRSKIIIMRKFFLLIIVNLIVAVSFAQTVTDSTFHGTAVVVKDSRIDILGEKMAAYNTGLIAPKRSASGYRLMVISTNDRDLAMKVRTQLYQLFPDQKQYMSYQIPNIKIKFGNFIDRADAERARKIITGQRMVPNNIYILPETIEIKPEKKDPNSND
jgi:hypothetical protein